MNIVIIGVNGFIGSHLAQFILDNRPGWTISGIDLHTERIFHLLDRPSFQFVCGDFTKKTDYVDEVISRADVVIPLAAIATPKTYVTDPLKVFELDFEANLTIIRACVRYGKRLLFPSTSEVYGMCEDEAFSEYDSKLVMGPVTKSRWIYACSKQLLDRIICAYGDEGLEYTIFRPFNWIGVGQDDIHKEGGSSRVITQFLGNLLRGEHIQLVDGGLQQRTFLDISDGIRALILILENRTASQNRIFNIGNPDNEYAIADVAHELVRQMHSVHPGSVSEDCIQTVSASAYYGKGYQDVNRRVPSIEEIQQVLGWKPVLSLEESLAAIIQHHTCETSKYRFKYDN